MLEPSPLPPGGYIVRKILVINSLQRVDVCKIFIANRLRLKYLLSTSWPRWVSGAFFGFISLFSIAFGVKLMRQADVVVLEWLRWFGGLTCVFCWGRRRRKCKDNKLVDAVAPSLQPSAEQRSAVCRRELESFSGRPWNSCPIFLSVVRYDPAKLAYVSAKTIDRSGIRHID